MNPLGGSSQRRWIVHEFERAHRQLVPQLALVKVYEILICLCKVGVERRHVFEMFQCHGGDICCYWTHDGGRKLIIYTYNMRWGKI